jgi:hypothetical protein
VRLCVCPRIDIFSSCLIERRAHLFPALFSTIYPACSCFHMIQPSVSLFSFTDTLIAARLNNECPTGVCFIVCFEIDKILFLALQNCCRLMHIYILLHQETTNKTKNNTDQRPSFNFFWSSAYRRRSRRPLMLHVYSSLYYK